MRLNALAPGNTHTPLTQAALDDPELGPLMREIPMPVGHWAEPREIAAAATWLLGPAASFMVGCDPVRRRWNGRARPPRQVLTGSTRLTGSGGPTPPRNSHGRSHGLGPRGRRAGDGLGRRGAVRRAARARPRARRPASSEKGATWGGSTAMSGGAVWIPNNKSMKAKGLDDSEDEGVKYLLHLTGGSVPEERIRTFVREGNRMIDYLEANTPLHFDALEIYPDYHPEDPGGRARRALARTGPVRRHRLGEEFRTLHEPYPPAMIMGKFLLTVMQARALLQPGLKPKLGDGQGHGPLRGRRSKRKLYDRDPFLTMGQSLMARLRLSLDRPRACRCGCNTPVESFVTEDGRVAGVGRGARR